MSSDAVDDPGLHAAEAEKTLGDYLTERGFPGGTLDRLAFAQVHALLGIEARLAQYAVALTNAAAALVAVANGTDHPPVPEQAATAGQADRVAENMPLWAGWQPGLWPVYDTLDPRGFRWANPLEGN